MIIRRTLAAALTFGCLTLAACSSSGDDAESGSPSAPAGGSSAPSSAPSSSAPSSASSDSSSASQGAEAELAAIGVQRGDVPSTFTAQSPDAEDDSDDDKALACIGAKSTKSDEQADAQSQNFSTETASISSDITRFGSQASVDSDAAIFRSPKVKDCFSSLLQQAASEGQTGAKIVSTDVDVTAGNGGGPSNVVGTVSGTLVLEAEGKRVPVYVTSVYITGPKLEVELTFSGFGTPFDTALAKTVTTAVAKRAAAA